jgi:plasmid stability protein
MRTTLNIDDHLYREVKVRAAREGRTVTHLVETALRKFLQGASSGIDESGAENPGGKPFPTIKTRPLQAKRHSALSIDEIGAQVKEAEADSDIERHKKTFRH